MRDSILYTTFGFTAGGPYRVRVYLGSTPYPAFSSATRPGLRCAISTVKRPPSSVALNQGHSQVFIRWRGRPSEREPLCGPIVGAAGVSPGAPLSPNFAVHAWSLTSKFVDCVSGSGRSPFPVLSIVFHLAGLIRASSVYVVSMWTFEIQGLFCFFLLDIA